jgi:hypothetical protein
MEMEKEMGITIRWTVGREVVRTGGCETVSG